MDEIFDGWYIMMHVRIQRSGTISLCIFALLACAVPHANAQAPDDRADGTLADTSERHIESALDVVEEPYEFEKEAVVVVAPSDRYEAGSFRSWFFGEEYRDVWETPLRIPVVDLERSAGGLTPLRRGGGQQTTSLHLEGGDGHFYVLRSVDKEAHLSLPEGLRNTFIESVVQDQISSLNPVGSLILPPLARAAGILHRQPMLVIIPDSPALGEFREEYAGMLAWFERKPDEDQSEADRFGHSENIIGSAKMFEKALDDNDERVDERAYVRVRLFDMLIGDWDRHDEQLRWAEFDTEHGTRFVAVPKDRDFAFVKFDGMLNKIGRRSNKIMLRRLVDFDEDFPDLLGLNWQGSKLDRRITSSLTRADWVSVADSLKHALTDEVIEDAVRLWPEPVFAQIGPMTIRSLKSRRDQLPAAAEEYYEMLAETVDIVGTDKHERFEVTRLGPDETEVVVIKTKKEGDVVRELSRRVFRHDETGELRLYGLGGNDQFIVKGEADDGILIRMIGGDGDDAFSDESRVAGASRLTRIYDTIEQTTVDPGPETKSYVSSDPRVNEYEMRRFELDSTSPTASFDYNSDDGIFIGGGIRHMRGGFRKAPYAARHLLALNVAPRSRAYNVYYDGLLIDVWNDFDGRLEVDALAARNFRNFYGLGNETPESNRDLFRAELQTVTAAPSLRRGFGDGDHVEFGPRFEFISVEPADGLPEDDPRVGFTDEQLIDKYFAGFRIDLALDSRDSLLNPQSGFYWLTETDFNAGVRNTGNRFAGLASELRYYYTLPFPSQITAALRVGGATNFGSFTFYQANTVGGENLRGFRQSRFAGRSSAFANVELRAALFDFNVYLTKGELGILGFIDHARVWVDGQGSNVWHRGYGGGVWATPFNVAILTAAMGFSEEGSLLDFSVGFRF